MLKIEHWNQKIVFGYLLAGHFSLVTNGSTICLLQRGKGGTKMESIYENPFYDVKHCIQFIVVKQKMLVSSLSCKSVP